MPILEVLQFLLVRVEGELGAHALLLDLPVLTEVCPAGNAHKEQHDGERSESEPAPQPTHEEVPSSGQGHGAENHRGFDCSTP
ncbi:hypothetical protein Prum_049750 [Phytohabitans rumicis]|uniref:Uncharacterized protein n=1 Tax=Phytohabitans rumicis TaxID=1076125 RepID=A0A6V8L219_9ACTN|nr:hypothetical protein Prum_049750 [Phytohabitans rumicis]